MEKSYEDVLTEIGQKVKHRREETGLSYYKIYRVCGVTQPVIQSIENGSKDYTLKSLVKVCEVLKLKVEIKT